MAIQEKTNAFSPSDFMRARRPELFPDTIRTEEQILDRSQFEFYLDTLTQRKEEIRFEHFCRRFAEKEICPNLIIQTGPTGGGDSKVDSETYPVAETISDRWYEGDPKRAARERWAFAFSAKKKWRSKVSDDVKKIAGTDRAYSLIYFISNQAIRDRDRADVEDDLRVKWGIEVRILDRSWIISKVFQNNRWEIVYQTLDISSTYINKITTPGPLDAERQRNLEELDNLIEDPERYQYSQYQLAEDCLRTALIVRGLGRPRDEIDGRFDRAERIARKRKDSRQLFRIIYHKAWTAYWWFDDFTEFDQCYMEAENLVLGSDIIWDLEKQVNLWQIGNAYRRSRPIVEEIDSWDDHTTKLREALHRNTVNDNKPSSSLWAKTQLILIDLAEAVTTNNSLSPIVSRMKVLLKQAEAHLDYPMEPLFEIIQEIGQIARDDESYEELMETVIRSRAKRVDAAEQGRMRIKWGFQKLNSGKAYDAMEQFAKAHNLLTQNENSAEFVQALVGTALGYESVGLLWASRANLIVALDRTLHEYYKDGRIAPQSLSLLRKLLWVELQLGRATCVLLWIELLGVITNVLEVDENTLAKMRKEYELLDTIMGILVLKTRYPDWSRLGKTPDLLEKYDLVLSRAAALFSLGHEDKFRSEYEQNEMDLDQFFSSWLDQPAADDLPTEAEWHVGETVVMRTILMGCEIEVVAENKTPSIVLGETILAFAELFMSTAIKLKEHYSFRPYLKIEIKQDKNLKTLFRHNVFENELGEGHIVIWHSAAPEFYSAQPIDYQRQLGNLLPDLVAQLQVIFSIESLEKLFSTGQALNRTLCAAILPFSINNLLGNKPKYHLQVWFAETKCVSYNQLRVEPWKPIESVKQRERAKEASPSFSDEPPPDDLFGVDGLKHRDIKTVSPINMPLWDRARWCGVGYAINPGNPPVPEMILLFEDMEAGKKIFRGWQNRIGRRDDEEWIGLTLITGIDRSYPSYYRLAISIDEDYFIKQASPRGKQFALVCRTQDMMTSDQKNLERFLHCYQMSGKFRLSPGHMAAGHANPTYASELYIEKQRLRVVPAWQIGPGDPACVALRETDVPIIPPNESNPPVLMAMDKIFGQDKNSIQRKNTD